MKSLIVNLYGGPGSGKSTTASGLFFLLKSNGVNAELVDEYAKGVVWENALSKLDNQIYIFAKQHQKVYRCAEQVDVVVTDSPIALGIMYGDMYSDNTSTELRSLIKHEALKQNSLNVLLNRKKIYRPVGRLQTKDEALSIDKLSIKLLDGLGVDYETVDGDRAAPEIIYNLVMERIK